MNQLLRLQTLNLVFASAFLAGCGGQSTPVAVQGTVSYKGSPVSNAQVSFHSANGMPQAIGITDENGSYQLASMTGSPKVVPGKYGISIAPIPPVDGEAPSDSSGTAYEEAMRNAEQRQRELDERLPSKYGSPETSELTIEVAAGQNNIIDFNLDE